MSQDLVGRPRAERERFSVERELAENKSEREREEAVQEQERCQAGREGCSAARELHGYEIEQDALNEGWTGARAEWGNPNEG